MFHGHNIRRLAAFATWVLASAQTHHDSNSRRNNSRMHEKSHCIASVKLLQLSCYLCSIFINYMCMYTMCYFTETNKELNTKRNITNMHNLLYVHKVNFGCK